MPDALELTLTIPAELGPAAEVLSELRDRVRAVELEREAERGRTGRRVLGRRAVLVGVRARAFVPRFIDVAAFVRLSDTLARPLPSSQF